MNPEKKAVKVSNLKKEKCQLCLRNMQKLTLLKCVTCENLGLSDIMCARCKRYHALTNTHKGIFVLAYPNEVIEL